jgi:hypothetical protein
MKITSEMKNMMSNRKNERGAALVSMLLLSMLLLTAGGALIMTTTLTATNAIDSTAEMQAYYGAEAGLQSTINVLRGNVWTAATTPAISLRSAVEPSSSNKANDPATDEDVARLSNWLSYTDTATYPSRVIANGETGHNVIAYDVAVSDVDNSKSVRYSTASSFEVGTSGCTVTSTTLTCGSSGNTFTLVYTPQAATTVTAYPAVTSGLGSFRVTKTGTGANMSGEAILRLRINQTLPWSAYDIINATISGDITNAASTLKITFLGSTAKVDGTSFALCGTCNPLALNHPSVSGGSTSVTSTVTAPQPKRVLVRSTGYGPKGSIKRLEMLVNRSSFMLEVPGVLTLRGSDNNTAVAFDIGDSNAQTFSGADHAKVEVRLPTFVVSGKDVSTANAGIKKHGTVDDPEIGYLDNSTVPATNTVSVIVAQTPEFLRTAENARGALDALQATATGMNRYYKPGVGKSYTVNSSNTTATGITFVDGDCDLDGGSGLLVVTGNLHTNGNPSFSGVILVLGTGTVTRSGNGNGAFYGAMVVAGFPRTGNGGFTSPSFSISGGGNGTLQYDSVAVSKAFGAIGAVSAGVREF